MKNGHLPWCPTLTEPCRCKSTGYIAAIVLAMCVAVLEFWGSGASGSLALLGDAWHVTSDVAVYVVALVANIHGLQNPRTSHAIKERGAHWNANVLIAVALVTISLAFWRMTSPTEVAAGVLLVVAVIGLVANIGMWFLLRAFHVEHEHEHDHLHETALLHTLFDTGISVAVVATGILLYFFPTLAAWRLDSLVTIGVCILLIQSARQMKRAIGARHHNHH
jgi:cobalt-zinc-cadmium efflux system protein